MSPASDDSPEARIARKRPFSGRLEIERVEPVGVEFSHSGTAFFVTARDGHRYKLRDCGRRGRAAEIERYLRALPDLFPHLVAREGRYLLLEALEEYRHVTHAEFVRGAERLGRMTALAHRADQALSTRGPLERMKRRALATISTRRFFRDLALLRRREILSRASCEGASRKYRAHHASFGLSIALELDDFHKGNLMIRDLDGDLRYVDEEGIALRPKGTGIASLLKTATRQHTLRRYQRGYAEIADPDFIRPEYVEYLLLMDTVRRVAFKVRTEGRLEKLPREVAELRELTDRAELAIDWRLPTGKPGSLDYPATEEDRHASRRHEGAKHRRR